MKTIIQAICIIIDHTSVSMLREAQTFAGHMRSRGACSALVYPGPRHEIADSLDPAHNPFDCIEYLDNPPTQSDIESIAGRLKVHRLNCAVITSDIQSADIAASMHMRSVLISQTTAAKTAAGEIVSSFEDIDPSVLIEFGFAKKTPAHPWTVEESEFVPEQSAYRESNFAVSNGLIGIRGTHDEQEEGLAAFSDPQTLIHGIYEFKGHGERKGFPKRYHSIVNLGNYCIQRVVIDGEPVSLCGGAVTEYHRELDMRRGVLCRSLVWQSSSGKRIRIESERFVSMERRHSVAVRTTVTPLNFSGDIEIRSIGQIDTRNKLFFEMPYDIQRIAPDTQAKQIQLKTKRSQFTIGIAWQHALTGAENVSEISVSTDSSIETVFAYEAQENKPVVLDKHLAFVTSMNTGSDNVLRNASDICAQDTQNGFDMLMQEQRKSWQAFWDIADIEIDGPVEDQQALRFSIFHLRQSHPRDDRISISATGLTGDTYQCHVLWDTEIYILPQFLFTQPEMVRSLLVYRHSILDKAREWAREMEGRGALYAWMSTMGEPCSGTLGLDSYHINCAVAYAVRQYVTVTNDTNFLYKYGAEMLFEMSRYMLDLGCYSPARDGAFCINTVTGPDEYGYAVNNNCYTNVLTQLMLNYAAETYNQMRTQAPDALKALAEKISLQESEPADWKKTADAMYIPFSEKLGVHAQDDGYLFLDPVDMTTIPYYINLYDVSYPVSVYRKQVTKQADVVLLMFLCDELFFTDVKIANYDYYEPRTNHGSSLSPGIHAIVAAQLGRMEESYDYLRQSALLDLYNFRRNTSEGVHLSCSGAVWMAVVHGFAGLRWQGEKLSLDPKLPAQWKSYRFKISYQGRVIDVNITAKGAEYALLAGEPMQIVTSTGPVNIQ
ncbi:MAG: hypothetical protein GF398_01585 [Chitinivibrionales bacterium]|nr:hypothetical protein [Chitinivibrionales bacterium]